LDLARRYLSRARDSSPTGARDPDKRDPDTGTLYPLCCICAFYVF